MKIDFEFVDDIAFNPVYGQRTIKIPKIKHALLDGHQVKSGIVVDPAIPFCTVGSDVVRQLGLTPKQNIVEIELTIPQLSPMKVLWHVDDNYGLRLGYEGFLQNCSEIHCFPPVNGYFLFGE